MKSKEIKNHSEKNTANTALRHVIIAGSLACTIIFSSVGYSSKRLYDLDKKNKDQIEQEIRIEKHIRDLEKEIKKYEGVKTLFDDGFGNNLEESFYTDIKRVRSLEDSLEEVAREKVKLEEDSKFIEYKEEQKKYLGYQIKGLFLGLGVYLLYFIGALAHYNRSNKK